MLLFSPRERRELALLERSISRKLTRAAPPQPEAVQGAKLAGLQRSIAAQTTADKDTWRQVAETWLASGNTDALAGLLALTLGGAPAPRSLLTGEEGWVTVELRGRPLSVPQIVRLLKQVGVGDLGRVQSGVSSGYADVRPHEARQLPTEIEDLQVGVAQNVEAAPQFERPRRRPEGNRVRSPRYNR